MAIRNDERSVRYCYAMNDLGFDRGLLLYFAHRRIKRIDCTFCNEVPRFVLERQSVSDWLVCDESPAQTDCRLVDRVDGAIIRDVGDVVRDCGYLRFRENRSSRFARGIDRVLPYHVVHRWVKRVEVSSTTIPIERLLCRH